MNHSSRRQFLQTSAGGFDLGYYQYVDRDKGASERSLAKLKKWFRLAHIKDAKMADGKLQYTFLGKGEVPVFDAINALSKGGYKGFYSFEWEKLWHPEIAEPELAFADYSRVMKAL